MSNKKIKQRVFIIPDILKEESVRAKFCYLALRNFIYYTDKGMHTQMKYNKASHDNIISELIDNYLKCAKDHNSLTKNESNLIKECFTTAKKSLIVKNDYVLAIEKELTFSPFAFYCNCILELSFHVEQDYFDDNYIIETINELSQKMLVKVNDNFRDFIVLDVNDTINALKNT